MTTANTYGLLYNWYALSDSGKVCPEKYKNFNLIKDYFLSGFLPVLEYLL
jgi:hypothetical protein